MLSSTLYICCIISLISFKLIPLAYIAIAISSNPSNTLCLFFTICGSNFPSLSLGGHIVISPVSVFTFLAFDVYPFLLFLFSFSPCLLLSYPKNSSISASNNLCITFPLSSLNIFDTSFPLFNSLLLSIKFTICSCSSVIYLGSLGSNFLLFLFIINIPPFSLDISHKVYS